MTSKLNLMILICLLLTLSSCYNVNQKVSTLTATKDLLTAMEQDGYLANYESIDFFEINNRVGIEKDIEVFVQYAMLIRGREDEITNGEKQNHLLLLYAIHNPESEKAIDIWANFEIALLRDDSESNESVKIDMCEIKKGIFCKLKQPPYSLLIADIEIDHAFSDSITTPPTNIDVRFNYKIEDDASSMFFKKLKDYKAPDHMTTTLLLDLSEAR